MAIDDIIVLTHPSGSSAKILKYGATVFQWTLANGTENLFLSEFITFPTILIAERLN